MNWHVFAFVLTDVTLSRALLAHSFARGDPQWHNALPSDWLQRNVYFLHVAKAAGGSALIDIPEHLNAGARFDSWECCWPEFSGSEAWEPRAVVTFMREPRAHVYSQWVHCQQNLDDFFNPHDLPKNFSQWLRYWSVLGDQPSTLERGFHCYIPINMQARVLSCGAKSCPSLTPALDEAVLNDETGTLAVRESLAIERVNRTLQFVGVTELYQESLCVLHVKSHREFPSYCNCKDRTAWNTFHVAKVKHGSKSDRGSYTLSEEDDENIRKLTQLDTKLYAFAKSRLKEMIHEIEAQYGMKILCRHKHHHREAADSNTIRILQ